MSKAKDLNTHVVYNKETREYELISLDSGEVVSSGNMKDSIQKYVFQADIAMWICQEIRKGKTLKDIDKDERFPPYEVIAHWRRMHPLFQDALLIAEQDRAQGYHDKVMQIAEGMAENSHLETKDSISAKKEAIKAFQWGAEKGDQSKFGKKQEIKHENTNPQPIVINTGITRTKPDVIVEAKKE